MAVHDKVAAATVGAALSQILIWVFEQTANNDVPDAIEVAWATLVVFVLGYFVPESKSPTR